MAWLYVLNAAFILTGDYFCVQASKTGRIWLLLMPALCWGVVAPVIWYHIFKIDGFAKANTVSGITAAIIAIAMGVCVFKEPLTTQNVLGLALAVLAMALLA